MAKETSKLNEKQKLFCQEYLVDLNATQAAIRAGYKPKNANRVASENLTKLDIQNYIAELKQDRVERVQITQDEVLADLLEIKGRCMQARPVVGMFGQQVKDSEGNNIWKFDAKGATKAIELIGKHIGFFLEDNKQKQAILNPIQNNYILPEECKDAIKHIEDFIGES